MSAPVCRPQDFGLINGVAVAVDVPATSHPHQPVGTLAARVAPLSDTVQALHHFRPELNADWLLQDVVVVDRFAARVDHEARLGQAVVLVDGHLLPARNVVVLEEQRSAPFDLNDLCSPWVHLQVDAHADALPFLCPLKVLTEHAIEGRTFLAFVGDAADVGDAFIQAQKVQVQMGLSRINAALRIILRIYGQLAVACVSGVSTFRG